MLSPLRGMALAFPGFEKNLILQSESGRSMCQLVPSRISHKYGKSVWRRLLPLWLFETASRLYWSGTWDSLTRWERQGEELQLSRLQCKPPNFDNDSASRAHVHRQSTADGMECVLEARHLRRPAALIRSLTIALASTWHKFFALLKF